MPTPRAASIWTVALAATTGCGGGSDTPAVNAGAGASAQHVAGDSAGCTPLETRQPNAPAQRPAISGQTRACGVTSEAAFDVVVLARGLEHPWAVEPLPGGDFLVSERPGRLRIVSSAGELGRPVSGVPEVDARGQGGLLDVALSPTFETDRTIYWSYAEPRKGVVGV